MSFIDRFLDAVSSKRFMRKGQGSIAKIEKQQLKYANFNAADFAAETEKLKERLALGEKPEDVAIYAFALVRQAAKFLQGTNFTVLGQPHTWNMQHYKVQLLAGLALLKNMVAEIATGEGKTLIATLPAYFYALYGKGCHIATVNEYLAKRDCEWMRPLYSLLGLKCACIYADQTLEEKKQAYFADITYGTSSEFGFDYLRDNSTAETPEEKVQRGFFYCLVDEADSILVDEARTPLIISGPQEDSSENAYKTFLPQVKSLAAAQSQIANRTAREVLADVQKGATVDDALLRKLMQVKYADPKNKILKQILKLGVVNVAFEKFQTMLTVALSRAIVNEISEHLYYVVDERTHSATLTAKGQNFLSPENPNAFTIPEIDGKIAEIRASKTMSQSEKLAAEHKLRELSFAASYRIHIVSQLLQAYSLYERDVDYIVRNNKIEIVDPNTGRVMEGRRWSDGLHQAVEAKENVKIQAEDATYATISIQNYFKMYKFLSGMTGTAMELAQEFADVYKMTAVAIPTNKPCARKDLPDLVYLTRKEKFLATVKLIVNARSLGRPVLVGTSSVEDSELLSKMLKMQNIPHNVLNAKNDEFEAKIVAQAGQKGQITISTNMAGRGTDIKLGDGVNELGGLFIIAVDHHHSPRVDRQLMGRCARQGDNGETVFVVSFQDDLLRIHADLSPYQYVMKNRHKDGVPFSHPLIARTIAKAQESVESDYTAARKQMLKFDNPSNKQRAVAYAMRDEIIFAEAPDMLFDKKLFEAIDNACVEYLPEDACMLDEDALQSALDMIKLCVPVFVSAQSLKAMDTKAIARKLKQDAKSFFDSAFENIENPSQAKKEAMLYAIDSAWRRHIARLDNIREGIYLRSYAQKDPYCEFEREAFDSFESFFKDCQRVLFVGLSAQVSLLRKVQAGKNEIRKSVVR